MIESTLTAEGNIPHLKYNGMVLVVKLRLTECGNKVSTNSCKLPYPLYKNGRLVYALPGGGEVLA